MIQVNTNLVQVDAVVTDALGRQVTDLTAADFEIVEGGQVRRPDHCSYVAMGGGAATSAGASGVAAASAADAPAAGRRTFAFIVANPVINIQWSVSRNGVLTTGTVSLHRLAVPAYQRAGELLDWFVETQVGPQDLAAIGSAEVDLGVLSSFTSDRRVLGAATDRIRDGLMHQSAPVVSVSAHITETGVNTDLRNMVRQNLAVLDMADSTLRQLESLPGRKFVVLLSRGMLFNPSLSGSDVVRSRMRELIARANRAGVTFYTLSPTVIGNFGGIGTAAMSVRGPSLGGIVAGVEDLDGLTHLARETGGRAIYNTNDTRIGLGEILEENRGYYLLAYNPGEGAAGRPHQIKVRVRREGLRVRARSTAYAPVRTRPAAPPDPASALDSAIRARELKVDLTPLFASADGESAHITSLLRVGRGGARPDAEPAAGEGGVDKRALDLRVRVTGPDGRPVKEEAARISLGAGGDEDFSAQFTLPADRPGFYRVSAAALDAASGLMGSDTRFVEVPDLAKRRMSASTLVLLRGDPSSGAPLGELLAREFAPGALLRYRCYVYRAGPARLLVRVTVKRGAQTLTSTEQELSSAGGRGPVALSGALPLGGLPAGSYTLELSVASAGAKGEHPLVSSADFAVR